MTRPPSAPRAGRGRGCDRLIASGGAARRRRLAAVTAEAITWGVIVSSRTARCGGAVKIWRAPWRGARVVAVGPLDAEASPALPWCRTPAGRSRRTLSTGRVDMRLAPILILAPVLVGWPATTRAGDVALSIDGQKFSAASVTMKRGDR